ncbi:hypothetical protein FUAX_41470 (plasmid) [Fulvitalea axinellae]|uniref:HTH araC/xylS-type domain-containing protein n=1 Tax=Fulvitalea axinellae TaxID=1182444 RepID=A0AAU9DGM8_9BACT|nr:hypothetical protein FUAX_41470 [Fulvitalea axinellae]
MSETPLKGDFIKRAEALVLEHLANEQFGVSELADLMHMSRSNLLRKVKKHSELSASQFIRQVRLRKGMELLEQTEWTVAEISDKAGFGNSSYFIKCFREQYGYSPGEVRKREPETVTVVESKLAEEPLASQETEPKSFRLTYLVAILVVVIFGLFFYFNNSKSSSNDEGRVSKKSIAVLPFRNLSSDSTNLYFVNGLMESSINSLQKIEDLRVVSRTSVEKFRNADMTISEIAEELDVNYLVEGSGQRVGDQVLLNIQLIDAGNDTPVWSEQYNHQVVDIFSLQRSVAKKIASAIQAKVTPAELERIEKRPTENLEAYDFYLKAQDLYQSRTKEGLNEAIPLFEKAIAHDPQFALAYSKLAITYYYLDMHQVEKQYTDVINQNADKALLYDSRSDMSLIAKALYYMHKKEFQYAIPHLEKALEYNPNSAFVVNMLSDIYARAEPNTAKYLKYALKGIRLDIAANDSIGKSYIYLHLSNAFVQNGFAEEALKYINLSLAYNPKNEYSPYLKVFIEYAGHLDMKKSTVALIEILQKDTTRLDIMQEVAKFYYFQERYDSAYHYYKKFVDRKREYGLNMYPHENLKIGLVYDKMGYAEQAKIFYKEYADYCENDKSIYKSASIASKLVHEGKYDEAMEQLKVFATKSDYQYWLLLFLEKDPLLKPLLKHPEFTPTIQKIKDGFWENHEEIRRSLRGSDYLLGKKKEI